MSPASATGLSLLTTTVWHGQHRKHLLRYCVFCRCHGNTVYRELFPSNGCCISACLHSCYLGMGLRVTIWSSNSITTGTTVYVTNKRWRTIDPIVNWVQFGGNVCSSEYCTNEMTESTALPDDGRGWHWRHAKMNVTWACTTAHHTMLRK